MQISLIFEYIKKEPVLFVFRFLLPFILIILLINIYGNITHHRLYLEFKYDNFGPDSLIFLSINYTRLLIIFGAAFAFMALDENYKKISMLAIVFEFFAFGVNILMLNLQKIIWYSTGLIPGTIIFFCWYYMNKKKPIKDNLSSEDNDDLINTKLRRQKQVKKFNPEDSFGFHVEDSMLNRIPKSKADDSQRNRSFDLEDESLRRFEERKGNGLILKVVLFLVLLGALVIVFFQYKSQILPQVMSYVERTNLLTFFGINKQNGLNPSQASQVQQQPMFRPPIVQQQPMQQYAKQPIQQQPAQQYQQQPGGQYQQQSTQQYQQQPSEPPQQQQEVMNLRDKNLRNNFANKVFSKKVLGSSTNHNELGLAFMNKKNYSEAAREYELALQENHSQYEIMLIRWNLGNIYEVHLKDYRKAIDHFRYISRMPKPQQKNQMNWPQLSKDRIKRLEKFAK